jgi:hypothetical protein
MRVSLRSDLAVIGLGRLIGLSCSTAASAQTIVDARHVQFSPSPDDDALAFAGGPVLDRYALQIFMEGGAAPVQTVDLGRPATNGNGMIRVDFVSLLAAPLTPGVKYEVVVQAIGPGGTSTSKRSNAFVMSPPPCDPWISPVDMSFDRFAGAGSIVVSAAPGCSWSAVSNDAWLAITSAASGSGNGVVTFSVAATTKKSPRNGTLTVAGSTFRVRQEAAK